MKQDLSLFTELREVSVDAVRGQCCYWKLDFNQIADLCMHVLWVTYNPIIE